MRRVPAILLLLAIVALGSGPLRYVHELDHADRHSHAHEPGGEPEHHDDPAKCFVHAQLTLPMLVAGPAPLLVLAGLLIAVLALSPGRAPSCRLILAAHPRGPPIC